MVDPGDRDLDIAVRGPLPGQRRHLPADLRHLVAFAPGLDAREGRVERAGQATHRIGQVADPGLGRMVADGPPDLGQHRHRPDRPDKPARPHRVAHGLRDPVARGDGDVVAHVLEPARQDRYHHHVGPLQSLRQGAAGTVGRGRALRHLRVAGADPGVAFGGRRVDVKKPDLCRQPRVLCQIGHERQRPVQRPSAHEGDPDGKCVSGFVHVVSARSHALRAHSQLLLWKGTDSPTPLDFRRR